MSVPRLATRREGRSEDTLMQLSMTARWSAYYFTDDWLRWVRSSESMHIFHLRCRRRRIDLEEGIRRRV